MALPEFMRMLLRRWWIIAVAFATVLAVAAVLTAATPTTYEATSSLFVPGGGERSDSYAELPSSERVLEAVIQDLDLARSTSDLQDDTAVAHTLGSSLIAITVRDSDAETAAVTSDAIVDHLIAVVDAELRPTAPRAARNWEPPIPISAGEVPESPASPKVLRNVLFGAVIGLALGIAAAIVREVLDTRLRDPEALPDQFGLPLLATVEEDKQAKTRPLLLDRAMDRGDPWQLGEPGSRSHVTEAFRHLRTTLQFFDFDGRGRSILITSTAPREGKTITAANLAITMGLAGESVVLVECDLRRPSLASYLGVTAREGLTDVVIGRSDLHSVLQRGEHLSLLPTGAIPPNPTELLGSQGMADVLADLDRTFDAVVIDSPSARAFADPAVLAGLCGATLVVVRMGYTDQRDLDLALSNLEAADARITGFVANRARIGRRAWKYYGYYARPATEESAAMRMQGLTPRSFNGPARSSKKSALRSEEGGAGQR